MNDIAFKVIIKNDGIDDVIFKTLMLKGEKGDKGDAGGAEIDDNTTASNTTWSSNKIRNEIDAKPDNLSELDDVDLDSISDEQLLGYNLTTGKWENKSVDASTLKYDANTSIKDKIDDKADSAGLSVVAVSGDYDDLSNKPSIPPAQVNADWDASSGVAEILNKPTIPVVDQTLNPSSSNAISNSAVANGLSGKANKPRLAWSGNIYQQNDTATISNFDNTKFYVVECIGFTGGNWHNYTLCYGGHDYWQVSFWGDNTQYCRYRIYINSGAGVATISEASGSGTNTAIVKIWEIA